MRKRIQGTEHEYTLVCPKMQEGGFDPNDIALGLLHESNLHLAGQFITNGSRAYLDCGHLELSTCETASFWDLLLWEKAGEKAVDWARKKAEEKYCSKDARIWAYKNNTSPQGVAYGSHENYIVSRKLLFPDRFERELAPHLVTRFIYTGAGDILDGKYVLSPSAYKTGEMVSWDTMHNTGVLNTRDETHGSDELYRRMHIQIGDALLGEWAIVLRNFTTSAIMQLIEDGKLGDVPALERPLQDMWANVERTNPDKWKIALKDGKTVSPIDIQIYYLEKIEGIVETKDEKAALKALEEVLDLLKKKDGKKAARKVEWLDRFYAISELSDGDMSSDLSMKICKRYSEIGEERSIHYRRRRGGRLDRAATDAQISKCITEPPADTRAFARRALCDDEEIAELDWSWAAVSRSGQRVRIEMSDPYRARY